MLEKLKIRKLGVLVIVIVLGGLWLVTFFQDRNKSAFIIVLDKAEFKIEKAETKSDRYQGLSFRERICDDCGMLFIMPEEGRYDFSMRDMRFDLDFLWIKEGVIVQINQEVPANFSGNVSSVEPVDWVLEIPGGMAKKNNLQEGDKVFLRND